VAAGGSSSQQQQGTSVITLPLQGTSSSNVPESLRRVSHVGTVAKRLLVTCLFGPTGFHSNHSL
jgi:hypothetical protein